jgi:AP-3 complex subunit beta
LLLLSINTFQKDLADSSPLIRGMAIRVLTSIRLNIIQGMSVHNAEGTCRIHFVGCRSCMLGIVFLGMQKLVNDRNQWVRKTVALGLIKIYELANEGHEA